MAAFVAVIGGGPAGLMAAERLAEDGTAVVLYDRMPSVGRKLLIAGRGGLNLTHSEPLPRFLRRYGPAETVLTPTIEAWPPDALRAWCADLGQDTFVGSSGRVFPTAFKATPLLRAWLQRLQRLGVTVRPGHRWTGWDAAGALRFQAGETEVLVRPDAAVLALGGASWPRLGSDGAWTPVLAEEGVEVAPLRAANAGFLHTWSAVFRDRFEGEPLKRIALAFEGETVRGEAIITADGIEGGVIYALSRPLRDAVERDGVAVPTLDLRPDLDMADLAQRLAGRGQSQSNALRKAGLSPVAAGLVRELGVGPLAAQVKSLPLPLTGMQPIGRAISSAGGVRFHEVDGHLMLRRKPGVFVAGEMLDWEAPTGGYLLQAAFSTGRMAAEGVLHWLGQRATGHC